MDKYDLKPEPKPKRGSLVWNILTVLTLIGAVCLAVFFVSMFINPGKIPAFLQPPALPTAYQTETPTITRVLPTPTLTFTPTFEPSPSRTRAPTWTPLQGMITPSTTPLPTGTVPPTITTTPMPAVAQFEYKASTTIHADSACKWFGVGGKVLTADNEPLTFQTVQLGGTLDGQPVNQTVLSGSKTSYGTSGFEFVLNTDHPIASTQTLWIQLSDSSAPPLPLSDKIYFDTYNDCNKNLVLVTFTKK